MDEQEYQSAVDLLRTIIIRQKSLIEEMASVLDRCPIPTDPQWSSWISDWEHVMQRYRDQANGD